MGWASTGARRGLRSCVLALAATIAALSFTITAADARHHRREHIHYARHGSHPHHHAQLEAYAPPSASIVVDGNTGSVLEESNADALRHPASLTKVMTLYLLFERLDAGKIRLDTPLTVSEHAAEQAPTKLDLKPGQTISVEDAIKAVVTRSANDVAVVIAENLGGSEEAFGRLMTQKARALGMSRTTYVNASGLPDDEQITTARDQTLLGRAIQDRFPRYYKFFSTTSFVFRGETIRGHNHLLGEVSGVDGIKTGFTEASGFNLLTSVHRDGRYIVGVVLGGRTASERDAHMRALIQGSFRLASIGRTPPVIASQAEAKAEAQPVAKPPSRELARAQAPARTGPASAANPRVVVGSSDPIIPLVVKTINYHTVTVRTPTKAMPVLVPTPDPPQSIAAETTAGVQVPTPQSPPGTVVASAGPIPAADPTPPTIGPAPAAPVLAEPAKTEPAKPTAANPVPQTPPHVHGGWVIQIGAFDGENEAKQHLSAAQTKLHTMLAAADPFTERVQKGDTTFYRARFAGFDKFTAEAACRQLKRSDIACMAIKD
jgi:D-alanyl-D-alanine carboxypeptidase